MRLKTVNKWLRKIGFVFCVQLYRDEDDETIRIEFWIERVSTYDARIPAEGFAVQIHKIDTPEIDLPPHPEELMSCSDHPPNCLDCGGVIPVESFDAVSFHCSHCKQHVPFCQCETLVDANERCRVCGQPKSVCRCEGGASI